MYDYNDNQKNAINEDGSVLVEASPGTGKTSTIVGRLEAVLDKISFTSRKVAVITYTNAGVYEIEDRLKGENSKKSLIGTIHSFCLDNILRPYYWIHKYPVKVISDEQILDFYSSLHYISSTPRLTIMKEELSQIRKQLNGELIIPERVGSAGGNRIKFCNDYENYKRQNSIMDFNDILYLSYKLLNENQFICRVLSNSFYEILVDEFQDTSELQYYILKKIFDIGKTKLFLVGDPKQTIMRFAGAKTDSFESALVDFNPTKITLTEHYRSSNTIVSKYMSIFENHPLMINKSDHKDFKSDFKFFTCDVITKSCIDDCYNCMSDVKIVDYFINHYISTGIQHEEIAILSPWHLHAWKVSNELRGKYIFRGSGTFPHKKISDPIYELIVKYIQYKNKSKSISGFKKFRAQVERCIMTHGLDITGSYNLLANSLILHFDELDLNSKFDIELKKLKFIIAEHFHYDADFIDEIIESINGKGYDWTLEDYFNALDYDKGVYNDTIHSSKGREFDVVIMFKMDDKYLPHFGSNDYLAEFDAERKLYVGLSRARKHIIIIYKRDAPSRFLYRIPGE